MSYSSSSSPIGPQRPSRFIEGEPLTRSPSSTTNGLFASILSEQDHHEARRRSDSQSHQSSTSSTSPSYSQPSTIFEASPPKQPIRSTRPPMDWGAVTGASSVSDSKGRRSFEESRPRGTTSEKIVGRLRALTASHNSLERRIRRGEITLYPGT